MTTPTPPTWAERAEAQLKDMDPLEMDGDEPRLLWTLGAALVGIGKAIEMQTDTFRASGLY